MSTEQAVVETRRIRRRYDSVRVTRRAFHRLNMGADPYHQMQTLTNWLVFHHAMLGNSTVCHYCTYPPFRRPADAMHATHKLIVPP